MPDNKYPEPDADWFREQAMQEASAHFQNIGEHRRCPAKWAEKRQQVHDYLAFEHPPREYSGLARRSGWRQLRKWVHENPAELPHRLCEFYAAIDTALVALADDEDEATELSKARRLMSDPKGRAELAKQGPAIKREADSLPPRERAEYLRTQFPGSPYFIYRDALWPGARR